jgi:glycerophosphoryl diester phosphodiesterase
MRILLYSIFLFSACSKLDIDKVENLNNGRVDIIAHGGGGFQSLIQPLPTNSMSSIKQAIDGLNADGMEIDLKVTIDSVVVLYHDNTLEKSTGCAGCPEAYDAASILNCKYKNYYGSGAFADDYIISLQQVIDHFKGRSKLPHIYASPKRPTTCSEKDPGAREKYAKALVKIIQDNQAYSWISIYDGTPDFLNLIRSMDPQINLIFNAINFDEALDASIANNYSEIVVKLQDVTKEQIKVAHDHNIKVTLWGMYRRKETIEALEKHPDAIMTDNIQVAQQLLKK